MLGASGAFFALVIPSLSKDLRAPSKLGVQNSPFDYAQGRLSTSLRMTIGQGV